MELQLAVQQSATRSSSNGRSNHVGGNKRDDHIPNYLKPSTGSSCHQACKYGGAHAFVSQDRDAQRGGGRVLSNKPPRKQPAAPSDEQQPQAQKKKKKRASRSSSSLIRVPRNLFGSRGSGTRGKNTDDDKVAADKEERKKQHEAESGVEWKDIVAYDYDAALPPAPPAHGGGSPLPLPIPELDDVNKDTTTTTTTTGANKPVAGSITTELVADKSAKVKPPTPRGGRRKPTSTPLSLAVKKKQVVDLESDDGSYQPLSPSLLQKRATLLRDLREEMLALAGHEEEAATNAATSNGSDEPKPASSSSLDQLEEELIALALATADRPIPAHRRVKSLSISSRSVRLPVSARQPSRNSSGFKLRSSRSSRAVGSGPPVIPSPYEEEEKKPPPPPPGGARLVRSTTGRGSVGNADEIASTGTTGSSRGIQLRIRSLRRRGVGIGGGDSTTTTGFVVPAVSLRHQKTMERKSQRLYNSLIEETAGRLVKTRKSRVKALVGAFESVISKLAK